MLLASRRQPYTLSHHPAHINTLDSHNTTVRAPVFDASTLATTFNNNIINERTSTQTPSYTHQQPPSTHSAPGPRGTPGARPDRYMSSTFDFSGPAIRVQQSTPVPYVQQQQQQQDFYAAQNGGWLFGQQGNAQMLANPNLPLNRRNRGHQRVSSGSSVGSNSPASPFGHATSLVYNGQGPAMPKVDSPYHDEASRNFSNHLPTPTQTPTQDSFLSSTNPPSSYPQFQNIDSTMAAHMAMKQAFADGNSVTEEDAPGFSHSTRHSVSSFGRNSPATPRTVNGDDFDENFKVPTNDFSARQNVQVPKLERTLTDIYTDELFNPTSVPQSSTPSKAAKNLSLLSPYHNAMMNERLQQANQARSQSPTASGARALSPFRQGSPYAQAFGGSPQNRFGTAAQIRQKQKADAEANALSHQNMSGRQDEQTISPKDAVLEYHENEEDAKMPLFPDANSAQFGGFAGGNYAPDATSSADAYGNLVVSTGINGWPHSSAAPYSATSTAPSQPQFNFAPSSVPGMFHGLPTSSYATSAVAAPSDDTPEFPAHLTSMESSASEAPPQSSQNSLTEVQRPSSTLADTGTYTCTYHGCTQRFETPQKLQRHKREAHRQSTTQQPQQQPLSTPGVGSGMTSAALAARNSQAGPHKCDRINPTTGKPCNVIFSRPYDLTRHEDTIHNAKKQKVRCALCQEEKTFSRNDALTRHMRVVHPDVDFPGKHRRRGGRDD